MMNTVIPTEVELHQDTKNQLLKKIYTQNKIENKKKERKKRVSYRTSSPSSGKEEKWRNF